MTVPLVMPDWPAPAGVRAVSSTRLGGVSGGAWASLNLGTGCGDDPAAVAENRRRLAEAAGLPSQPAWLRQVHGIHVVAAQPAAAPPEADGAVACRPGVVCAVLTADCLPVLFCDRRGTRVAAAHAGWRGMAAGILEAVVARMGEGPSGLMAWLGPAIGRDAFEVGPEVRDRFLKTDAGCGSCFSPGRGDRWFADLEAIARRRLAAAGVGEIYGGGMCTYRDERRFFSYRRDGACGRMATLVWLERSRDR